MYLLAGIVAAVVVVFNFSEITQDLVCEGEVTRQGDLVQSDTAYVELTEYRWWVGLWSDSDGMVAAQFDQVQAMFLTFHMLKIGDGNLALFSFWKDDGRDMTGGYRAANSEIILRIHGDDVFTRRCKARL